MTTFLEFLQSDVDGDKVMHLGRRALIYVIYKLADGDIAKVQKIVDDLEPTDKLEDFICDELSGRDRHVRAETKEKGCLVEVSVITGCRIEPVIRHYDTTMTAKAIADDMEGALS